MPGICRWLDTFYDDIPVLLLLARYQEQQGLLEAAANTLLLARTYALAGDQLSVTRALRQLTLRTDERLSNEQRWIQLLGYYEYPVAIDKSAAAAADLSGSSLVSRTKTMQVTIWPCFMCGLY